jgi:hypothetical protein
MASRNDITGDLIKTKANGDSDAFAEGWDRIFGKKKQPLNEYPDNSTDPEKWDESRIDVVGSNGNDGDHYGKE